MTAPEPAWAARFWAKVNFSGPVPAHRPELGPCHTWTAAKGRGGYGLLNIKGRMRRAHQLALELAGVEIPDGHEPDHLCRNPPCVRRSHLEPVTRRTNFLRGEHPTAVAIRSNICQSGRHEMTESNTITKVERGRTKRKCRLCENEGQRRRHASQKAGV